MKHYGSTPGGFAISPYQVSPCAPAFVSSEWIPVPRRKRRNARLSSQKLPRITLPKMPEFPEWLAKYEAVRERASELWSQLPHESDPDKAQRVLEQLITNSDMISVWEELYKRNRAQTGQYLYPTRIGREGTAASLRDAADKFRRKANNLRTEGDLSAKDHSDLKKYEEYANDFERAAKFAFVLSDERSENEQDRAVQAFFSQIYRATIDGKPKLASKSKFKVQKMRTVAANLRADVL